MGEIDKVPEQDRSIPTASGTARHARAPNAASRYFTAKNHLVHLRTDGTGRHGPVERDSADRVGRILQQAEAQGLVGREKDMKISGRVNHVLVERARASTRIESTTDLIEYALAKVAVEDRYGDWLVDQEGTVSPDLDLDI